jgi:hypothetical protein
MVYPRRQVKCTLKESVMSLIWKRLVRSYMTHRKEGCYPAFAWYLAKQEEFSG